MTPPYAQEHVCTSAAVALRAQETRESTEPRGCSVDTTISGTYLQPATMASLFLLRRTPTDPTTITDRRAYFSPSLAKFTAWEREEHTHVAAELIDTYERR